MMYCFRALVSCFVKKTIKKLTKTFVSGKDLLLEKTLVQTPPQLGRS